MEGEIAGAAAAYSLVPLWLQELARLVQAIAVVAGSIVIPVMIWAAGKRRDDKQRLRAEALEKRRATLDLIRILMTDPSLLERASRFYRHRRFKEGGDGAMDPYADLGKHALVHDCLVILNVNDTACIEILSGRVEEEFLFKTARDAIIGATIVLDVLNAELDADRSENFPHLVTVSRRWKYRAEEERAPVGLPLTDS